MTPTGSVPPAGYRSDIILFMALAFVLSWASWFTAAGLGGSFMAPPAFPFFLFGAFGPLVAALVIRIRRTRRGEPVPAHAVRFRPSTLLWAPLLMAGAAAIVLVSAFIAAAAGGPAPSLGDAVDVVLDNPVGPVAFLVNLVVAGPLSEEPGWRGTAQPRMRASMGRIQVAAVLGAIWAVWHLPLFFINGTVQNVMGLTSPSGMLYCVSSIPMAMLVCYAYERAGVVASIAVHCAVNASLTLLGVQDPVTMALVMGIQLIVAVALLSTMRATTPDPAAAPASPAPTVAEEARVR